MIFLLDTSGSIEQIYHEHVRWALALIEGLPIEQDTVRVAAVQYAGINYKKKLAFYYINKNKTFI